MSLQGITHHLKQSTLNGNGFVTLVQFINLINNIFLSLYYVHSRIDNKSDTKMQLPILLIIRSILKTINRTFCQSLYSASQTFSETCICTVPLYLGKIAQKTGMAQS